MPAPGALGHRDRGIRQRRAADAGQVHAHDAMLARAERTRDARRAAVELGCMALAVVDRERVALEALRAGDREHRGGIESAGEQHHRACRRLPLASLLPRARCPTGTCGAGSGSAPAAGPRGSSRRARARAAARGSGEKSTRAARVSPSSRTLRAAPLVVGAVADDELHLILRETRELLVAVARLLPGAGRLHVHDRMTRGSTPSSDIAPLVSSDTRSRASQSCVQQRAGSPSAPAARRR